MRLAYQPFPPALHVHDAQATIASVTQRQLVFQFVSPGTFVAYNLTYALADDVLNNYVEPRKVGSIGRTGELARRVIPAFMTQLLSPMAL